MKVLGRKTFDRDPRTWTQYPEHNTQGVCYPRKDNDCNFR